jgi:hypothetical protein
MKKLFHTGQTYLKRPGSAVFTHQQVRLLGHMGWRPGNFPEQVSSYDMQRHEIG